MSARRGPGACSGSALTISDIRGLLALEGLTGYRDGPGGAGRGRRGLSQLPVVAVFWIAPSTEAGLPVMAWPIVVLIWFSTVVQLVWAG